MAGVPAAGMVLPGLPKSIAYSLLEFECRAGARLNGPPRGQAIPHVDTIDDRRND